PADGAGAGLRLRVRVGASSLAEEGRARLGFRYGIGRDPPMEVLDACWLDVEGNERREVPAPQIQLMAPPRVARVSDLREEIRRMGPRAAHEWARAGAVHGVFRLIDLAQQRTPLGRGLRLVELAPGGGLLGRFLQQRYRVQFLRPLVCDALRLEEVRGQAQEEASGLGLDMESDAVVEWWLDRQGYDGALLAPGAHTYGDAHMAIAFRRAQIAQIVPLGVL
ncbi:MAG TPA: zinc ribbon domain-containing protein, partial [Roseiflexaceae bacterium]|nr:zinc ribbon domain-containing protein [Roseiflexaceae bacterium]